MRLFYFTSVNLAVCEPGAKAHIENILFGLHGLNWEITLFSCKKSKDSQPDFPFNHRLVKKQNQSLFEQVTEQARLFWLLLTIKDENPDLVYIRTSPLLIIPILFAFIKKIPVCLEVNAAIKFSSKRKRLVKIAQVFENWALMRSKIIITTTDELKAYLSSKASLDSKKIHVIPMGFESDLLNCPIIETRQKKFVKPEFTIGYMGQFHKRQGITDLINAIPLVIRKYKNVCFEIAGKGLMEDELKSLVKNLKIEEFVRFPGFLDKKRIPFFLKRCDLVAAPYFGLFNKNIPMGSPTKIFIYLACGKPVVTTRLPALDLFKPCEAVFFCEPDSPEDLARVIINQIEKTSAQRHDLGRAGRNFVKKHFTWKILSKKTGRILENAL